MAVVVFFSVLSVQAAERNREQMLQAAVEALNGEGRFHAPSANGMQMVEMKSISQLSLIGYEDGGFAVIARDDRFPAVLGVSNTAYSGGANANFEFWLSSMNAALAYRVENNIPARIIAPDPNVYPTHVGPLMTTEWDQLAPYNGMLPTGIYTGCVATAIAQVLKYHRVPEHGIGSRTIYAKGTPVTATFEEDYYDWDNMLDRYRGVSYSETEADAVALLMRDCGVASNMSYGNAMDGGSGAFSPDAAHGLRTYFGLLEAQCLERNKYNDEEWMDLVYTEISTNGPLYYGGTDMSIYSGHAFVLHGYREDGLVYVNWGWSGDEDGYYDISLLNPPGYKFSTGQDMIIGVSGDGKIELQSDTVVVETAGHLAQLLSADLENVGSLKVKGEINGTDLRTIRWMGGCDENLSRTKGHLRHLDLSEARFVSGGNYYVDDNGQELTTRDNVVPDLAFYACRSFRSIILPDNITHIGKGAFGGCLFLDSLVIPENEAQDFIIRNNTIYPKSDTLVIQEVLPTRSGVYEVPRGIKEIGDYAFAGCTRIYSVTVPSSVERIGAKAFARCSGLSSIKLSLSQIPETGMDALENVPFNNCVLFVPAGSKDRYKQHSQWGQFAGGNGGGAYDNIKEFGSAITARNAGRLYGSPNPVLGYQMSGDVVQGEPELVCDATIESPAGEYPIKVLPGTVTDEIVEYFDGILFVWKVPLTVSVGEYSRMEGEENPEFELSYSGFVMDEDISALTSLPVAVCEADINSPVGSYPILISGGEAQNYSFKYQKGMLTVLPDPTAIRDINLAGKSHNVYAVDGRLLRKNATTLKGLPAGVYVVDGKKIVIK